METRRKKALEADSNDASTSFRDKVHPHNVISIPLSSSVVLTMARYGARGQTETQLTAMMQRLSIPDTNVLPSYQKLIDTLNNMEENELLFSNKVFTTEKYPINPVYKGLIETYFRSETQLVNFENYAEAAKIINEWVGEKTKGRINELISPGNIDGYTPMVFVNAIYFKGEWQDEFDSTSTTDMPFHYDLETTKDVPMMLRQGNYRYGELPSMNAQFIEIPYKGGEVSMVVVVPNEIDGLDELKVELRKMRLTSIVKRGRMVRVKLYLPKLEDVNAAEMKEVLQEMGWTDAFDNKADFSEISNVAFLISQVNQRTFISLDENGSETAVVTSINGSRMSRTKVTSKTSHVVLKVDRPSYYAVCHNHNHLLLFNS